MNDKLPNTGPPGMGLAYVLVILAIVAYVVTKPYRWLKNKQTAE